MWLSAGVTPDWIQFQLDKTYKLYQMKVWNSNQQVEGIIGFGAKSVKIEYSLDGSTWTELPNVPEFTRAAGMDSYSPDTTVDFAGISAQYVKLTINSTWGGLPQAGLSEVRFFYVPLQAREPKPAVNAMGQELDFTLSWRPGREAASHKVYLATDPNAIANGTVAAGSVSDHSFNSGGAEPCHDLLLESR